MKSLGLGPGFWSICGSVDVGLRFCKLAGGGEIRVCCHQLLQNSVSHCCLTGSDVQGKQPCSSSMPQTRIDAEVGTANCAYPAKDFCWLITCTAGPTQKTLQHDSTPPYLVQACQYLRGSESHPCSHPELVPVQSLSRKPTHMHISLSLYISIYIYTLI